MIFRPYEYQKTGIRWVLEHPYCALFLDMGLGKSVITLTAISRLIDEAEIDSALIVAPKKVAESTWKAEAEKWEHTRHLRVSVVLGSARKREAALTEKADVYVTSRDNFVWLVDRYKGKLPFGMVVLDELTSFKSSASQRFKAMRLVRPSLGRVVGLTGTPAPNGLLDLWAQLYCLDLGERLGKSKTRYRQTYFNEQQWNHIVIRAWPKKGSEEAIRSKIADLCLSMQAKDYLELPALMEHTEYVDFSPAVERRYEAFEKEQVLDFAEAHKGEPEQVIASSAAALMNKLCQFTGGAVYDDEHNVHEEHTEKMERLTELVEAAQGGVLVFYQFRHEISRITAALKGCRVRLYEGDKDLRDWNAGEIDVLLAHPASTAFGLNMQEGGHYIVWYGTGWNLELYQQANARLHRQGQRYPVQVYRLVCRGTVDEKQVRAMNGKKNVQQSLLDGLKELMTKYGK